jgi:hypothetical protein
MSATNRDDIQGLLERAAELAGSQGIESEQFMAAAWQAYLASHPAVREELEDKALRSELRKLRKLGLIASA